MPLGVILKPPPAPPKEGSVSQRVYFYLHTENFVLLNSPLPSFGGAGGGYPPISLRRRGRGRLYYSGLYPKLLSSFCELRQSLSTLTKVSRYTFLSKNFSRVLRASVLTFFSATP